METTVKAALFHGPDDIEEFNISVTEPNYRIVIDKLELERKKIITYLKDLKSKEIIKSIFRPKNKKYQTVLNKLVEVKRYLKQSINSIEEIYK